MITRFIRLGNSGAAALTLATFFFSTATAQRVSHSRSVEINVAGQRSSLDEQGFPPSPSVAKGTESDGPIRAPMLGYIFDKTLVRIRPIVGIAGSSYVGDALDPSLTLSDFYYFSASDYALALVESRESLVVLRLSSKNVTVETTIDVYSPITRLAVSPRGSSAALYCNRTQSIQVVTGIPNDPGVTAQIDMSDLPLELTALAVSDDGKAVLCGIQESGVGLVYLSSFEQEDYEPTWRTEVAAVCGEVSEVAFLRNSKNALVADRARDRVFRLQKTPAGFAQVSVASLEDGVCGPVALALSDDGSRVFIANSGSSSILIKGLMEGVSYLLPCKTLPTKLARMNGQSVYQLTDVSGGPLLILDASEAEPNVYFVPFRMNHDASLEGIRR
jgi:hypothetical protein